MYENHFKNDEIIKRARPGSTNNMNAQVPKRAAIAQKFAVWHNIEMILYSMYF